MARPSLNTLIADLASPPIPEAQGWTRRYDGRLGPLVNLSQAAPGAPPAPALLERLAAAAGAAPTARYGPIEGDGELRAALAADVSGVYGGAVVPGDIAITAGCNEAFVVTAMMVAGAGDAVILPAPWYFNHKMTLDMLGIEARPLMLEAQAGFVPDPAAAEALIDERTRAVVLVTPNNPTGAVYPPAVLDAFLELCRRRGLWLVLDETYRDFLPAGHDRPHGLLAGPGWRDNLIGLYSFSKSYGIPGHRLGAMILDADLVAQAAKILDSLQICASRPGQAALAWGIPHLRDWREENRAEINRRAAAFQEVVAELPGWRIDSIGAYFAYLRHPFPGISARAVAERLAADRGVLALPGSYFGPGQEGHLRVAFANVDMAGIATLPGRFEGLDVGG